MTLLSKPAWAYVIDDALLPTGKYLNMTHSYQLSKREKEVADLLLQGKSNKQIALTLKIAERTVEFHLKNIYIKLEADSRVKAILNLRENTGVLRDSTVAAEDKINKIVIEPSRLDVQSSHRSGVMRSVSLAEIIGFLAMYKVPVSIWILFAAVLAFVLFSQPAWTYEREGEYPDEATVGQVLQRSDASGGMAHAQFGTVPAWPPQPGYVRYANIRTPRADHLFLKLRYSKYSSASVDILVYLDDELSPRATILPVDQGSWEKFIWTNSIDLGPVGRGVHAIKFYTDGQVYGVADLDKFTLTTEPP